MGVKYYTLKLSGVETDNLYIKELDNYLANNLKQYKASFVLFVDKASHAEINIQALDTINIDKFVASMQSDFKKSINITEETKESSKIIRK